MKKLLPLFALALMLLAAAAARASAQTSFLATDDAYVRGGALANTNFNTSWTNPGDALRCRQASADTNDRKSYIKFDFTSYSGVVGTATLKVWVDRCVNSNGGNLFPDTAMVFTAADDNWSENQPGDSLDGNNAFFIRGDMNRFIAAKSSACGVGAVSCVRDNDFLGGSPLAPVVGMNQKHSCELTVSPCRRASPGLPGQVSRGRGQVVLHCSRIGIPALTRKCLSAQ